MKKLSVAIALVSLSVGSMADRSRDRLERFSNLHAAPGYEAPVRKQFIKDIKPYGVKYEVDKIGNVYVRINPGKHKKKVLVMAHMDEVGFMVTQIDEQGFMKVMPIGGWLSEVTWAQEWALKTNKQTVLATSGFDAPHVTTPITHEHRQVTKKDFFLDSGMTPAELKQAGVRPGTPVTPNMKFKQYGQFYAGKAFDDRAGMALMVDAIAKLSKDKSLPKNVEVQFAATVQEEVGLRGARTVYEALKPDVVLNLEAGIAHDYPMQLAERGKPELGKGASIFVYDRSMIPSQDLVESLVKVAEKHQIPYQWESEVSYGEDGAVLQGNGHGVTAVNIGIPVRYAHSHVGLMSRKDYDNGLKLVLAYIREQGR